MTDSEEENVHTEDDDLPQEEEMGLQRCVTEDVSEKRKYLLCCVVRCGLCVTYI